jgi:hypothetical protein
MRRAIAVLAFTTVLASAAASFTVLPEATSAAEAPDATFLVPANDGYGVGECLATGGECGRVIADAWCETQGYARAVAFGPSAPEDLTGGVQTISTASSQRPVAVTCAK